MKKVQPPPVRPDSPRLSDSLRPFASRKQCQRCGVYNPQTVSGWRECDHKDQPEYLYVFLCKRCGKELIEPHPRLYVQIMPNDPLPGIMDICVDCPWRRASKCTSPLALFNGGDGLKIDIESPTHAHLYFGGGKGCFTKLYPSPARACSGKTTRQ